MSTLFNVPGGTSTLEGAPFTNAAWRLVRAVRKPTTPLELHPREERKRLNFEAMMRVLDRELPEFAD